MLKWKLRSSATMTTTGSIAMLHHQIFTGQKIIENDNQCKSGRIKLISDGKMMGGSFTTTRKEISRLKEVFQGYEALSHDHSQRLSTALDNGDLDTRISIMHYTMCKQIMLTANPCLKAFMEERCNDDEAASDQEHCQT